MRHLMGRSVTGSIGRSGFTLVEALFVLAIIAVLLALLLPGLQRARALSYQTVCQVKLRTLYQGSFLYSMDNHQRVPLSKRTTGGAKYSYSDDMIKYLMPDTRPVDANGDKKLDGDVFKVAGIDFFRCPTAATPPRIGSNDRVQVLDFGYNHYGYDNPAITPPKLHWNTMSGRRRSEVANPTVVFMADADAQASPEDIGGVSRTKGSMEWPIRTSFEFDAFTRHLDGHNIVQFDGATTWYSALQPHNDRWFIRRR